MRTWNYITDDGPAVSQLDLLLDEALASNAGTMVGTLLDQKDKPIKTYGVALVEGRAFGVEFDWHSREMLTAWCNIHDSELVRLEGGVVCLAHSSMVSGDAGICEYIEGDLPPGPNGEDEAECGPFRPAFYEDVAVW